MSTIKNKIFSNFRKRIEERIRDNEIPSRDTDFNITDLQNIYNTKIITSSPAKHNNSIVDEYYTSRGDVSLISTMAGFAAGTNSASDLTSNFTSKIFGDSTIGNIVNIPLNNSLVKNTINEFFPSPGLLGSPKDGIIKDQMIPSEMLLQAVPPPAPFDASSGSGERGDFTNNIIDNGIVNTGKSILTNLASSGKFNLTDVANKISNNTSTTVSYINLARQGLKYTQAVGMYDNSPTDSWYKQKIPKGFGSNGIIYNKYISDGLTKDKNTTYKEQAAIIFKDEDTSPLVNKYNNREEGDGQQAYKHINTIETKFGYSTYNGLSYNGKQKAEPSKELDLGEDYDIDSVRDLITFKFEYFENGSTIIKPLIFKATFTGLGDDISTEWNSTRYLGRADQFHNYVGFSRSIAFDFMVDARNKQMLPVMWRKINKLVGLCYPTKYNEFNVSTAPIVILTIGNLYRKLYGKFSSINVKPHADTLWEIEPHFQLPQVVDISVSFDVMYEGSGIPPQTDMHHFNNKINKKETLELSLLK